MHSDHVEANLWLERPAIIEQETVAQDVIVAQPARMLRATEIAVRFGCSARTVNRWGRLGVLPVVKIQGSTFYRHSDVEALLAHALDRLIECARRKKPAHADRSTELRDQKWDASMFRALNRFRALQRASLPGIGK